MLVEAPVLEPADFQLDEQHKAEMEQEVKEAAEMQLPDDEEF